MAKRMDASMPATDRIEILAEQIAAADYELVFVDLDGVMVDLAGGIAYHLFHRDPEEVTPWGRGLVDELGITRAEFWRCLNAVGQDFWANLEPLDHGVHLWEALRERGVPLRVLTSCTRQAACLAGKHRWMQKWLRVKRSEHFEDFTLTANKWESANPNRLLIDDTLRQVESFRAAGGHAILWRGPDGEYVVNR